jgi:hypothetical protein
MLGTLIVAVGSLARPASAQTVQLTMYADIGGDDSTVVAYAQIADETDLGQWGGQVYHYDYSSGVSATTSQCSDSDSGSGLGYWYVALCYDDEDTLWLDSFFVSFVCSAAGGMGGYATPPPPSPIFTFSHNYLVAYTGTAYRNSDSLNRVCAPPVLANVHEEFAQLHGTGLGIGTGDGICIRVCRSGYSTVRGPTAQTSPGGVGSC